MAQKRPPKKKNETNRIDPREIPRSCPDVTSGKMANEVEVEEKREVLRSDGF
jgi:hypothetical protein